MSAYQRALTAASVRAFDEAPICFVAEAESRRIICAFPTIEGAYDYCFGDGRALVIHDRAGTLLFRCDGGQQSDVDAAPRLLH